jgi:hypothetical protein
MLRPFLVSVVLSGVSASGVGADNPRIDQRASEVSTWRWNVSMILDAQRAADPSPGAADAKSFAQRYERYSVLGLPEAPAEANQR